MELLRQLQFPFLFLSLIGCFNLLTFYYCFKQSGWTGWAKTRKIIYKLGRGWATKKESTIRQSCYTVDFCLQRTSAYEAEVNLLLALSYNILVLLLAHNSYFLCSQIIASVSWFGLVLSFIMGVKESATGCLSVLKFLLWIDFLCFKLWLVFVCLWGGIGARWGEIKIEGLGVVRTTMDFC